MRWHSGALSKCQEHWACEKHPYESFTLNEQTHVHTTHTHARAHTNRLCCLDSYEAVVSFLPTNIAKSSVVRDVLGDVGDLVDRMVVLENL